MAIKNGYKSGLTLFEKASKSVEVRHKNNTVGLNIDDDTDNVNGGICSGITTAWLIMLINNNAAAREGKFAENFELTRFQGAYLKELHGRTPDHLAELDVVVDSRLNQTSKQKERSSIKFKLPLNTLWGAYVSAWGHAIGIGQFNDAYYIMDPNFGLYKYTVRKDFLKDFQTLIEARAKRKGKNDKAKVTCIFFDRSSGLKH